MFTWADLHGIVPPLLTPVNGTKVDTRGVARLVEHVVTGGVHGVFVAGTTGEFPLLSESIWHDLVSATVASVAGRVPVLVGVTQNSTAEAIRYAEAAAGLGANFVVASTPYYFRHSQHELRDHFRALAEASPLPVLLYNIPQNTANALTVRTVAELASEPNIVGVKDSSGNIETPRVLRQYVGSDFRIFLGTDSLGDVTLTVGANGTVPSLANLAPQLVVEAWNSAIVGDTSRSAALHAQVAAVASLYQAGEDGSAGGFVAALRYALSLIDLPIGPPIPPVHPLSLAGQQTVERVLREAGMHTESERIPTGAGAL